MRKTTIKTFLRSSCAEEIYGNWTLPIDTTHIWQPRIREVRLPGAEVVRHWADSVSLFFFLSSSQLYSHFFFLDPRRHYHFQHLGAPYWSLRVARFASQVHRATHRHSHRLADRPFCVHDCWGASWVSLGPVSTVRHLHTHLPCLACVPGCLASPPLSLSVC